MSLRETTLQGERVDAPARGASGVRFWLFAVAALIFVMVLVGGATRLTESGLSITQWKPVTGVVPPLSDAEWRDEFSRYQQIPQFAALNPDMTLEGFKTIFWWEWSHRLLARIIGVAFIVPALWFALTGRLRGAVGKQVAIATGLLALEPIVGWWMVSSGLSERTEVAQERLAMHLMIAAATFGVLIYSGVGLRRRQPEVSLAGFGLASGGFAALVFAQLGLGAVVAGLRAGLVYNSWPLMDGRWIPPGAFGLSPWPRSVVDDVTTAQFDHRIVAYAVVAYALVQAFFAWRSAPGTALARRAMALAGLALGQAALGVATLLFVVPIGLALAHQALALTLFGMAMAHAGATGAERAARVRFMHDNEVKRYVEAIPRSEDR
jgi:cytochrome c oxidase assembly protein subunit 15